MESKTPPLTLDSNRIFEIIKKEKTLAASYKAIVNESFVGEVCFNEEQKTALSKCLSNLSNSLQEKDIKFWIDWGSFLGGYRDKSIIPWDKDFDIAILSKDKFKLANIITDSPDLSIAVNKEHYMSILIKGFDEPCLDINIWDKVEKSTGTFITDYNHHDRDYCFFKDLDSIYFEDLKLSMPCPNLSKADELLSGMYGENFMLPPGNPLMDSKGKLWIENRGGR